MLFAQTVLPDPINMPDINQIANNHYTRGHLLNVALGGRDNAQNLAAGTASMNQAYATSIEENVRNNNLVVNYTVSLQQATATVLPHARNYNPNFIAGLTSWNENAAQQLEVITRTLAKDVRAMSWEHYFLILETINAYRNPINIAAYNNPYR